TEQLLEEPEARLLVWVGLVGAGKSRLGIAAAYRQVQSGSIPDGVWLLGLEELSDTAFLTCSILDALDVPPHEDLDTRLQVLDYLHDKQLLLVLDNFERLQGDTGLIVEILQSSPGVRILATSIDR